MIAQERVFFLEWVFTGPSLGQIVLRGVGKGWERINFPLGRKQATTLVGKHFDTKFSSCHELPP